MGQTCRTFTETFRAARAPYLPPEAAENVVSLRRRVRKKGPEQDVSVWGGEDSNLRPADYEFAKDQASYLRKLINILVRGLHMAPVGSYGL